MNAKEIRRSQLNGELWEVRTSTGEWMLVGLEDPLYEGAEYRRATIYHIYSYGNNYIMCSNIKPEAEEVFVGTKQACEQFIREMLNSTNWLTKDTIEEAYKTWLRSVDCGDLEIAFTAGAAWQEFKDRGEDKK